MIYRLFLMIFKREKIKQIELGVNLENEEIQVPMFDLDSNEVRILPYNLTINGSIVKASNAQLWGMIDNTLIFVHPNPEKAEIIFEGLVPKYLILTNHEIERNFIFNKQLYVSDSDCFIFDDELILEYDKPTSITAYPSMKKQIITVPFPTKSSVEAELVKGTEDVKVYQLKLSYHPQVKKHLLNINFMADRCELWQGNDLIADHFMIDGNWKVSLQRFDNPSELILNIFKPTEDVYYDFKDMNPDLVELRSIDIIEVHQTIIS
ncbi:hypothetical protein ACTQ54_09575 [Fundicoccus sp. Sow4_H7]|uniref:hypothetical protein n=1 Tax=Fundicoccus sp. Sow4_H7 TaxID=3438784 RepID=UPI003F91E47D